MKLDTTTILKLRDTLRESGRRPTMVMSLAYDTLARQGLLGPEESTSLQWVDPIAEAMYLTIAADGQVNEAEQEVIRGAIRDLTDNLIRSGTMTVMFEEFQRRLEQDGRDHRLRALAEALADEPTEAEATFALAATVALADDEVAEEENSLVCELGERLGVSDARRAQILAELEQR